MYLINKDGKLDWFEGAKRGKVTKGYVIVEGEDALYKQQMLIMIFIFINVAPLLTTLVVTPMRYERCKWQSGYV